MKKLLVLLLVAAAGYFAYQKFIAQKGGEAGQVSALESEFSGIKQQLVQAERSAGATGMDMTSEADSAMGAAEALLRRVRELKPALTEEEALRRAETLEAQIQAFLKKE
ncbi:MAG TPA: DLW-39 family protein [Candidatus Aminicenantes bacterium]|nr:DLW-39 family protein [Candidatus Aminicenantes bacterium]